MRRFVLLFALFAAAGFGLVLAPPLVPGVEAFTRFVTAVSGRMIRVAGTAVLVDGNTLVCPENGFSIAVVYGCNGINVVVLLWAAVLAWPAAGWRDKLKGIAAGALIVEAINTLRIISLYYLGRHQSPWFEYMHLYVWEVLIMLVGLGVFAGWIRRVNAAVPRG